MELAGGLSTLTTLHEQADGSRVRIRPIVPSDRRALEIGFGRMSAESRQRRFLSGVRRLTPTMLAYLTEVDYLNHFALVGLLQEAGEDHPELIAVGRYVRLGERPAAAEVALTVGDAYHGRGIGHVLLEALIAVAQEAGISTFVASVRQDNAAMRALLPAPAATARPDGMGVLGYEMDLAVRGQQLAGEPVYRHYRMAARTACAQRSRPVRPGG